MRKATVSVSLYPSRWEMIVQELESRLHDFPSDERPEWEQELELALAQIKEALETVSDEVAE